MHKRVREIFTRRIEKVMGFAVIGSAREEMENATRDDWEVYNASRALVERYNSNAHQRSGIALKRESRPTARPEPAVEPEPERRSMSETTPSPENEPTPAARREDEGSSRLDGEEDKADAGPQAIAHSTPPPPSQHKAPEKKEENILIQAMEDIPPFAGLSRTYELKKGDVSFIPAVIANILLKRGLAERVESK